VERGRRDEGPREALSLGALPWVNTALSKTICSKPYAPKTDGLPYNGPYAGYVIKYYKGVLDIMYVTVGIKKLLKTNKFEIIVRRRG